MYRNYIGFKPGKDKVMKKVVLVLTIVMCLTVTMATTVFATEASPSPTDSVSKVITDGFEVVKVQAKEIVFNVVIWVLIAADIVYLIIKTVTAIMSYRQGQGFNAIPIIAAAAVLVLLIVIPEALWALLD